LEKKWIYRESEELDPQVVKLAGGSFLAQLLSLRGIKTFDEAQEFLKPENTKLVDPYAFSDMKKAVDRIEDAVVSGEHIVIYGDFDADGVTSTALLIKTFEKIGANFSYYIPNRASESHGLNTQALVGLVSKRKVKLLITVDCGVSDVKEVAFLKSFGVDVIITDHHEAPDTLPEAFAIINPRAENALDEGLESAGIRKLCQLSGVGVAFKLAGAVLKRFKEEDFCDNLIPLVAVGAIADVVPILGENRYYVAKGLKLIEEGVNKGVKALLASCYFSGKPNSETIAFMVAPRINASGRLDTVESALTLLISEDDEEIKATTKKLNAFNVRRQELCDEIFEEALELVSPDDEAIVLMRDDWHVGVIGIVASKLVERFNKPAFLMCKDEEKNLAKCSIRSIEQVNVYDILNENSRFFEGFGGHAMAGGFAFDMDKYSFDEVKASLLASVKEACENVDLTPVVYVDAKMQWKEVNYGLVKALSKLEPFGEGNPPPLFSLEGLNFAQQRTLGQNGAHLKFFAQVNNFEFECVMWNKSALPYELNTCVDIVFTPKINDYNGRSTVQLEVCDIKGVAKRSTPADKISDVNPCAVRVYDHRKREDVFGNLSDYLENSGVDAVIFAQSREALEILSGWEALKDRIVGIETLRGAQVLIMFEYPNDEKALRNVVSKVGAGSVHLMRSLSENFGAEELIGRIAGMLKYACGKNDGQFDRARFCAFLNINDEMLNGAIKTLVELGVIELVKEDKVRFLKGVATDVLIKNAEFKEFCALKNKADEFKKQILGIDVKSFIKLYAS